jgi:hypothetical protein
MMSTVPDINFRHLALMILNGGLRPLGQGRVNIAGCQDHLRNRPGQAVRVRACGMLQMASDGFCPRQLRVIIALAPSMVQRIPGCVINLVRPVMPQGVIPDGRFL